MVDATTPPPPPPPIDPAILRMAITAAYCRWLLPGPGHVVAAVIDACILVRAAAIRGDG